MVLFGIAGVFSAEVTKAAGNETLIQSPNCGYLEVYTDRSDPSLFDALRGPNAMDANDTLAASAYSRACYGKTLGGSQCHQLPKPNIPWTNQTNLHCPFGGNICKDGVGGFEMDTGFIDSLETLGINSKASEAVQYRKVTSCSVLRTTEYSSEYNITNSENDIDQLVSYNYGTFIYSPENFTYAYDKHGATGSSSYALTYGSTTLFPGNEADHCSIRAYEFLPFTTKPIAELNLSDADVTLMFLAPNSVKYMSPVSDPLYKATIPTNWTLHDGENFTTYSQDFWVSVLACADRFQFRNPANGISTSLTNSLAIDGEIDSLRLTELQSAIWFSLYYTIGSSEMFYSVNSRGASSLRASETVGGPDFVSPGLPDNQWQIEAADFFSISLAKLQQKIIGYATGPTYYHEGLPFKQGDKDLCQRQKIRGASGYLSFSVFGVSVILVLGCLFIVAGLVLDSTIGYMRRKLDWNDYKRLQWAVDEKLQIQRLAFEEAGQGTWTGGTDAVPMTGAGGLVGIGSNPNKHHPRLLNIGSCSSNSEILKPDVEVLKPLVTTTEM